MFFRLHAAPTGRAHRHPTLLSALLVASAFWLGSCYRAEIDLSPLAEAGGGSGQRLGPSDGGSEPASAGASSGNVDSNGASGGRCQDPPLSADDQTCLITGEKPTLSMCVADPKGWPGCYNGGCSVCTQNGVVRDYPYYLRWHPCCSANDTCSNHDKFRCNSLCPAPTEHDKVPPCGENDPNPG